MTIIIIWQRKHAGAEETRKKVQILKPFFCTWAIYWLRSLSVSIMGSYFSLLFIYMFCKIYICILIGRWLDQLDSFLFNSSLISRTFLFGRCFSEIFKRDMLASGFFWIWEGWGGGRYHNDPDMDLTGRKVLDFVVWDYLVLIMTVWTGSWRMILYLKRIN